LIFIFDLFWIFCKMFNVALCWSHVLKAHFPRHPWVNPAWVAFNQLRWLHELTSFHFVPNLSVQISLVGNNNNIIVVNLELWSKAGLWGWGPKWASLKYQKCHIFTLNEFKQSFNIAIMITFSELIYSSDYSPTMGIDNIFIMRLMGRRRSF